MSEDSIFKRNWVKGSAVLATAALSLVLATPAQAAPLAKVKSATQGATENVVEMTFQGGSNASGLPQTGDPATVAVAATGISGAIAAFFGAFRRRKDK